MLQILNARLTSVTTKTFPLYCPFKTHTRASSDTDPSSSVLYCLLPGLDQTTGAEWAGPRSAAYPGGGIHR
jgi:hypothetical protein